MNCESNILTGILPGIAPTIVPTDSNIVLTEPYDKYSLAQSDANQINNHYSRTC